MRFPHKQFVLGLTVIGFMILACALPGSVTPTPSLVTLPPTGMPATSTPIGATVPPTPALPVVASPQIDTIHMLDVMNGWAISDTNLLRTSDGGSTWFNATPPA
jgi:hypothetical protein